MKNRKIKTLFFSFLSFAALLLFVACPTSDEPSRSLKVQIDKDNDSLLTFDSLVIKVYSKDSSYSQEVFHGVLRDPSQVSSLPLDPRIGKEYTVSFIGYKGGQVGVNQLVTILGPGNFQSKDLIIQTVKPQDSTIIVPSIPEIMAPTDTSVAEGDSLRLRITVRNPFSGPTTLTLKDAISSAALDTTGRDPGDGYFTWRPGFDQGRSEPYAVTFVYASAERRVEKITRVKVINSNRPPKIGVIADQQVKEGETLSFKVNATDPDLDSLAITAIGIPGGATFTSNSFNWKPSAGQAGNYSLKFKAFDGKDSDMVAVLITVGDVDVPPAVVVKITSPTRDTSINFTPITLLYTVNGTLLQRKFPLKDGKNKLFIDTTVGGRTAMDTITITLDTVPPGKPIVNGSSPVSTRTPTWTWTSGGNGTGTYRYRVDNEEMVGSTIVTEPPYTATKDLDPGPHTLFVQEQDAAGNWSLSGKKLILIDTTRPAPPTVSAETSPTRSVQPTWTWLGLGNDLTGLFRYKLDNADLRTGAVEIKGTNFSPKTGEELKEGIHTLYVQQQDSAGNWSNSGSKSIRVDLTPPDAPKIKILQTTPYNTAKPTWFWLSGGVEGMGHYRLKIGSSDLASGATEVAKPEYQSPDSLKEGAHILYVQERDSAGNWSSTTTIKLLIDITPPGKPVIDSLPRSPLNDIQPVWSWSSGGGGAGLFRCRLDNPNLNTGSDTTKEYSFKPKIVLSEELHTLYVQEADSAGNWSATTSRGIVVSMPEVVGIMGISPGSVFHLSLAFSPANIPFVAFADKSDSGKATVMNLNGGVWRKLGNGASNMTAADLSIAISPSNVPYITFGDGNGPVRKFTGGAWQTVGTDGQGGVSPDIVYYPSIAFGKTNVPYVAFTDWNDYKIAVAYLNDTSWVRMPNSGFPKVRSHDPALVFSSSGTPLVAFSDATNRYRIVVMRFNGTTWDRLGGGWVSGVDASAPSLAVDPNGVAYVAFSDSASGGKARVLKFTGSTWVNVGKAEITNGGVSSLNIAVNSEGDPFIAFKNTENAGKAMVMRCHADKWDTVGIAGLSPGEVEEVSLSLSATGVPYIAFSDVINGGRVTVMKTSFNP